MSRIYCREEKVSLKVPEISTTAEWSYVSEFFIKNKHAKPKITAQIYKWTLDEARDQAYYAFETQNLTPMIASTYLYRLAETIEEKLTEDWTSYNVVIGSKKDKLTPLSLCNFEIFETPKDQETTLSMPTDQDDIYLGLGVCGYYRVSLATTAGNYDGDVIKKISELMKEQGYKGSSTVARGTMFGNSPTFESLIACYDMFFHKFRHHSYAIWRAGTLVARYKDCAILGSLHSLQMSLTVDLYDLFLWIFAEALVSEVKIIIKSPDELSDQLSYTPYLHGFRLVTKSPYSTQTCLNLHFWIHLSGICLGSKRSINARMLGGADLTDVPKNSFLLSFAYKRASGLKRRFAVDEAEAQELDEGEDDAGVVGDLSSYPSERDPGEWYDWFAANSFDYDVAMSKYLKDVQRKVEGVREGSIGEFYKQLTF